MNKVKLKPEMIIFIIVTGLSISGCSTGSYNNPDLRNYDSGDEITVRWDTRDSDELAEQMLSVPCREGNVVMTIFNSPEYWEMYDHSVQVCYNEKVDCDGVVEIHGLLDKFQGKCWKGATEDEICNYYFIEADEISCIA